GTPPEPVQAGRQTHPNRSPALSQPACLGHRRRGPEPVAGTNGPVRRGERPLPSALRLALELDLVSERPPTAVRRPAAPGRELAPSPHARTRWSARKTAPRSPGVRPVSRNAV